MAPSSPQPAYMTNEPAPRELLYYPFFYPPHGPWLRQALLYWDRILTIIPEDPSNDLNPFGERRDRHIRELQRLDALWPVRPCPDEHSTEWLREAAQNLKKAKQRGDEHSVRMRKEKFAAATIDFLQANGMAFEDEHGWIPIGRQRANDYMCVLAFKEAQRLRDQEDRRVETCTKNVQDFRAHTGARAVKYLDQEEADEGRREVDTQLTLTIQGLLPVPKAGTPLAQIVEFRREYGNELDALDFVIDAFRLRLSQCATISEMEELSEHFQHEARKETDKIEDAFKLERIPFQLNGLSSVIIPTITEVVAAAAEAAHGQASEIFFPGLAAGVTGGAIATIGVQNFLANRKQRARARESDFAFLLHARQLQ